MMTASRRRHMRVLERIFAKTVSADLRWSEVERNSMLEYKGYTGRVDFDNEAEIFHGEVCGLRDVITFQGGTSGELKTAFQESIDDYLEFCQELGQEPDRPFSGKLLVRMPPELHRELHNTALAQRKSINSLVVDALEKRTAT